MPRGCKQHREIANPLDGEVLRYSMVSAAIDIQRGSEMSANLSFLYDPEPKSGQTNKTEEKQSNTGMLPLFSHAFVTP